MANETTPMMKQYRRIKAELAPDVILFFRLGDFYEMFFEDAEKAAPVLGIALTKRNKVPMCGVPHHALDGYLSKLIRAGLKIAICEQVEDASATKGIVRREVARVVTPGTIIEDNILDSRRNNFLAGLYRNKDKIGFALLDLSTGLFKVEELSNLDALADSLRRSAPNECLVPAEQYEDDELRSLLEHSFVGHVSVYDDWVFEYDAAYDNLIRHFEVHSLEGFGCEGKAAVIGAAAGILYYVREDLRRQVTHVKALHVVSTNDYLVLDEATCLNLDLVARGGGAIDVSLLRAMDVAKTAMGGRKLRSWLVSPPAELGEINARHDAVEALYSDRSLLRSVRDTLGSVRDLERLITRISGGSGNARDLQAVGLSLRNVPLVRDIIKEHEMSRLSGIADSMVPLPELVDLIEEAIIEEPPIAIKEGGIIKKGYNADLDKLRDISSEGKDWLAQYQASEQERTGIKNLKVRHNRVFGYYIEISKGQLTNVPDDYIRKQTMVNAERFITPELKEYESKIVGAQGKSMALEYDIFIEIRNAVSEETERIQSIADAVAELDVIASFADRALALNYVRPVMTDGDKLIIKGGRHPVVEQMPDAERFVPNDTVLDCTNNQLAIITGPNMAGKSTYIRQVALITVMAQMGAFVPADEAELPVVDRVFTRVGASDDLARGRSTFMVEMQETANILNNATPRSLIVLDEIGRGTSTFDGISIAWAVAEYLHNNEAVKAKTLFATHYHELTDLARTMSGIKNYNVLVREKNDKIAFLRKIVDGASDKSYGIQVARLAGMPRQVIDRSKEILSNLEEGEFAESGQPKIAKRRTKSSKVSDSQMDLFGS